MIEASLMNILKKTFMLYITDHWIKVLTIDLGRVNLYFYLKMIIVKTIIIINWY